MEECLLCIFDPAYSVSLTFKCWWLKDKIYFNNFKVGMIKNGRGYSSHKIIKLAVSQESLIKEF